ncbi:tumor protein p53-inducible nuclear protein 2 [Apis dorsata]|uniref:tumor protein p53-inducible nuclear protein 2 n=1 Tax=Apis dorsata TaxID=7462 RepID=UPI001293D789|nr:tumor protein p53-inducible nuclear protein 2 [Apis dorsata]
MCGLKSKKVRMLSSLANYLLGGNISGAQDSRERSNNESPESLPVIARLSQVEVEGEDWILIDRAVEGATALEESWYVTPPACFTRAGPVNVETSPLEDLLIEHPSMSVYRATASPVAPPAVDRARTEKRIAQLRSASQKVFEKRSTQALKRGRLERSNKLREVFSVKGKRPRRQDRLRIQNSGANNNRKC